MKVTKKPLVVGNWKMNPATIGDAKKTFIEIRTGITRVKNDVEVVIAAPFPYLPELQKLAPSKRVLLAAQDVYFEPAGAFTGEVSLSMLKSVGVTHVIVGHSERRAMGETDAHVAAKVAAVSKHGLMVVVCVGEKKRDSQGDYFSLIEAQIQAAISGVTKNKLAQVVIAYEPIWAIGTGKTASAQDVHEMKLFITKVLSDAVGRNAATKMRIIYGGSVKADNAEELFTVGEVDGFLPGGASLKPKEFISIIKTVASHI